MSQIRWLPLESNPDVMNKYIQRLGVKDDCQFYDVYGFDPELLFMIPRPVLAVLLLYPLTPNTEGEPIGQEDEKSEAYFIRQTIGNACGTIGIIHSLCNNENHLTLDPSKHLADFLKKTKELPPEERGAHLESDKGFGEAHEESAQEGQTVAPSRDEKIDLHFVAFVHNNGSLYEMDGRKKFPINHGKTSADTLLEDSIEVVKKFVAREPNNPNFTVVALAKS